MLCSVMMYCTYGLCTAGKMIDMKMEAIQRRVDANQEIAGEYLTYLLSNVKMSSKDVYGSISELLLAGVDTVRKSDSSFDHLNKIYKCFIMIEHKALFLFMF